MDLTWSDGEDRFRADARVWLAENLAAWRAEHGPDIGSGDTREGFALHQAWERRLFEAGWAVVSWPAAYGGRDASLWEWLLFEEEYYRAGAPPRITQNGIFLLAPSLFEYGSPEQQRGILPRMAAGDDSWCQGWSEPEAGSDLASLTSRATRTHGGWRLDGQKTWTTRGAFCTHLFGLFRTDPESQRHRGLTYFMVPLDTPGVTVRGFGRLDGDEGFAEVFFTDAFVADDAVSGGVVLGEVGQGWSVALATTGSERGLTLRSPGRFLATADRLLDLCRSARDDGADPDGSLRRRVIDGWMRAEAYQLSTLATVTAMAEGASVGAESSLNKIWWSELDVDLHSTAMDLLGPGAALDSAWSRGLQFALSGPIYAGTNEIQRNIVAERVLGLPEEVTGVRFAFTDDQLALRDAVRVMLAKECRPEVVRAAWPAGAPGAGARADGGAPVAVWARLAEMGVLGVAVPEDDGGSGLGALDWVLLAEETGYVALPHPFVETALVAAPVLVACGDPRDQVGRIVAGELALAAELTGAADVAWAGRYPTVLVREGDSLFLAEAERGDDGGTRAVDGALTLGAVAEVAEVDRISDDAEVADRAFDRGALGAAAQLIGLSQRMLDLTVSYVGERRQFGVPVGSFQAVKHHLADALVHLAFARPAVHRAAYSVAHDLATRGRDVSMAKAMASDAARLVGAKALQCHGAIGYTVEYDLHLYLKRAWVLAATWGTAAWHRDRVGRAIGV